MQRRTRRQFSWEFKVEAVRLVEGGRPLLQVARDLDVKPALIRAWRKQVQPEAVAARDEAREIARLRRELAATKQELEFLKKAAAYFASRPR